MNGPFFLPIWMWEWGGWRGGVVGRTGGGEEGKSWGGGGVLSFPATVSEIPSSMSFTPL